MKTIVFVVFRNIRTFSHRITTLEFEQFEFQKEHTLREYDIHLAFYSIF